MKEKYTYCNLCEKETLVKVYSPIRKKKQMRDKKVGDVVHEYIKDTKEEVKQEKERLKKEEYKQ